MRLPERCSVLVLAALLAFPLAASASTADSLSLVPADATTVGLVRLNELRVSPLSGRIFREADRATTDGETRRFMQDAGLDPSRDIDVVIMAMSPDRDKTKGQALVIFEGRFEPERLSAAVRSRGATAATTDTGVYWVLPEGSDGHGEKRTSDGAVAFLSPTLAIAGNEEQVKAALSARSNGGTNFLSRSALAPEVQRIDPMTTSWLVVDVPRSTRLTGTRPDFNGSANGPGAAVANALKRVSFLTIWANDSKNELQFGATARSDDPETRQLLVDTVRGLLAAWRLTVQDKAPDLVPVIRRFQVDDSGDSVRLTGTLPAEFIRQMSARRQARR